MQGSLFVGAALSGSTVESGPDQLRSTSIGTFLPKRDRRLDLFRGISLWFLFLEQIPPADASLITLRAEKFNVAVAVFIVLFGYTAGLVYGQMARERGFYLTTARILRRAWQVYVAQVLLFAFHIIQIDSLAVHNSSLAALTKVVVFVDQPAIGLFHGLFLDYQPVGTEVLAVYIVLLLGFAPMLWLLLRYPLIALATSTSLYLLARQEGWNLPAYPTGVWPLNPLTWQLLFVIGAWFGLGQTHWIERIPVLKSTRIIAATYLILALLVWIGAHVSPLAGLLPGWLEYLVRPSSATALDVVALLHVASLAILAVWLIPENWSAFGTSLLRPMLLCGRYPLATLCFGVFLAFAGRWLFAVSNIRAVHIAYFCGGIALMAALALILAWIERETHQPMGA
jgi:hypothetical protein